MFKFFAFRVSFASCFFDVLTFVCLNYISIIFESVFQFIIFCKFLFFSLNHLESKSPYFNSDFHVFVSSIYFLLKMNRTKRQRTKNKRWKSQIPQQLQILFLRPKSKNLLPKKRLFRKKNRHKPLNWSKKKNKKFLICVVQRTN